MTVTLVTVTYLKKWKVWNLRRRSEGGLLAGGEDAEFAEAVVASLEQRFDG